MADEHRARYTESQLTCYFDRIHLPDHKRIYHVRGLPPADQLTYLTLLQKHTLVSVPWENLSQHYSWHHTVHVDPTHLYGKIAADGGQGRRGGYCMEANSFMGTVLLSLGFDVYYAGARIWRGAGKGFGGWTHIVNLVTIAETKYLIDGGFGSNGSTHPLPLHHDEPTSQIAPCTVRLLHTPISQNLDRSQKLWIYQFRINAGNEWHVGYCFTELEFLPEDVVGMNLHPATSRHTFFTHKVVCVRFTTEGEDLERPGVNQEKMESDIDGALILNHNILRWRRKGQNVIKRELISEKERLDALEKYFGISFDEADRAGISGMASELGVAALEL